MSPLLPLLRPALSSPSLLPSLAVIAFGLVFVVTESEPALCGAPAVAVLGVLTTTGACTPQLSHTSWCAWGRGIGGAGLAAADSSGAEALANVVERSCEAAFPQPTAESIGFDFRLPLVGLLLLLLLLLLVLLLLT